MKYIYLILSIIISCSIYPAVAQKKLEIKKWETFDISMKASTKIKNPFKEVMGCLFTCEDGSQLNVQGVYNDQSEWILRFTPNKTGKWMGQTYSSIKDLSGKKLEINVTKENPDNHGGIKINPENKKHFIYESGKPYFLMAFEADWLFALDYGNDELTKTETLVNHIKANGFNQIVMNVYAYDVRWKKDSSLMNNHDYGSKLNIYPFGGNNENPDHTTINVDFFKHLDRVIELLQENDIVSHLMIYVWNKEVNWPKAYSEEDNQYFDYVVKRYQGYNNLVWDISKEALGYGHDDINYITNRIERLRKLDAYNRLLTVHDYYYCSQYPGKVDIISIQSWVSDLYNNMVDVAGKYKNKPIFNIEHGGYELSQYQVFQGNYDDPEICLRRNYLCAFAGTYTTYYWQGTSWNVVLHDPDSEDVDPKPKFSYYKNFIDFFETYGFDNLQPVYDVSASGYCLSNNKDTYIYYVPRENAAIDIKKLKKCNSLEYKWFNPLTGKYSGTKKMDWSNYFRLNPEFKGVDNILIIYRR